MSPSLARPRADRGVGRPGESVPPEGDPILGVDSGRQSLYRHSRADTETIKYDPELQRSHPCPSLANRSEFQHSGEVTDPSGGSAKDVSIAHPDPESPYPQGGTPALSPTLDAGKPQDCSLRPAPLGGAIQVANGVIGPVGPGDRGLESGVAAPPQATAQLSSPVPAMGGGTNIRLAGPPPAVEQRL